MAINFPDTAGQATDGTFTYTVAGITYAQMDRLGQQQVLVLVQQ